MCLTMPARVISVDGAMGRDRGRGTVGGWRRPSPVPEVQARRLGNPCRRDAGSRARSRDARMRSRLPCRRPPRIRTISRRRRGMIRWLRTIDTASRAPGSIRAGPGWRDGARQRHLGLRQRVRRPRVRRSGGLHDAEERRRGGRCSWHGAGRRAVAPWISQAHGPVTGLVALGVIGGSVPFILFFTGLCRGRPLRRGSDPQDAVRMGRHAGGGLPRRAHRPAAGRGAGVLLASQLLIQSADRRRLGQRRDDDRRRDGILGGRDHRGQAAPGDVPAPVAAAARMGYWPGRAGRLSRRHRGPVRDRAP